MHCLALTCVLRPAIVSGVKMFPFLIKTHGLGEIVKSGLFELNIPSDRVFLGFQKITKLFKLNCKVMAIRTICNLSRVYINTDKVSRTSNIHAGANSNQLQDESHSDRLAGSSTPKV